ncbi:TlpA family protein disulfide reductase [Massilia sp. Dwa41.01b]|uniref:TlpA family protein disulfide reductase n=1 Tax=unclassified Massilia TaxID=2609279 RepID=UPI001602D5DF|nr:MULTISPECIES: TlpA disulfide reductase family protein [unclassified Massilia]QNA90416.1 TlpA family protein disulfide reductase [Massilia sp. Dwa41.01b]QNA97644.1 TlpA family protein disulfide reductase [Massilia sp. Se16.2.3]
MNKKKLAAFVAVAIAFGALGAVFGSRTKEATPVTTSIAPTGAAGSGPAHTASTHLYAQTLNDLSGKPQALSQWKGKPLLVNFWATWCGPCVQEMPELSSLANAEGGKRFNVIGIGIDSPDTMREFATKHNIKYPLYVGGMDGTELSRAFGNTNGGLPFTVLIGADGQVRKTYLGKLEFDALRADLAGL